MLTKYYAEIIINNNDYEHVKKNNVKVNKS